MTAWRPTSADLEEAHGRTVPDLIAHDLLVLFCGINPGLYSAAVGHHFARPGNRFWPALHLSGFTDRLLSPFEERDLLRQRLGITNVVDRASASAGDLTRDEIVEGAGRLERKVRRFKPRYLAVCGVGAYRTGFDPRARIGPQERTIGTTSVWVLPNPSGLNAHYQLPDLVEAFAALRAAVCGLR